MLRIKQQRFLHAGLRFGHVPAMKFGVGQRAEDFGRRAVGA
jgi:hypothetical protein